MAASLALAAAGSMDLRRAPSLAAARSGGC
jgi:hypothetical protein